MALSPGTRIGPYEVAAPLGAGGMGEVYRARDPRLGRDIALKILPASVAADPDRRARFEREARTLAALNHLNIAQIYDVGQTSPDLLFLAMELVDKTFRAQETSIRSTSPASSSTHSMPRTKPASSIAI
jgi:serine/threonine protein kinase